MLLRDVRTARRTLTLYNPSRWLQSTSRASFTTSLRASTLFKSQPNRLNALATHSPQLPSSPPPLPNREQRQGREDPSHNSIKTTPAPFATDDVPDQKRLHFDQKRDTSKVVKKGPRSVVGHMTVTGFGKGRRSRWMKQRAAAPSSEGDLNQKSVMPNVRNGTRFVMGGTLLKSSSTGQSLTRIARDTSAAVSSSGGESLREGPRIIPFYTDDKSPASRKSHQPTNRTGRGGSVPNSPAAATPSRDDHSDEPFTSLSAAFPRSTPKVQPLVRRVVADDARGDTEREKLAKEDVNGQVVSTPANAEPSNNRRRKPNTMRNLSRKDTAFYISYYNDPKIHNQPDPYEDIFPSAPGADRWASARPDPREGRARSRLREAGPSETAEAHPVGASEEELPLWVPYPGSGDMDSTSAKMEPKASSRFDDQPRGRQREKLRRRQQFILDDEEMAVAQTDDRVSAKRARKREREARKSITPVPVLIPEFISVDHLSKLLKVRSEDFSQMLHTLGFGELPYDHVLNGETAGLIAMEYNFAPMIDESHARDLRAQPPPEDPSALPARPPVVTIMGHVDHGKTTILDYLRKSSVAAGEFGGITQHIGAFSVPLSSGKTVTFLDTPGHAAFLDMRQRGANVTDIVVLVVAADDSVKPQTIEAIKHAKAAQVPMIVVVNKIDKEEANVERVKQDLARHDVEVEDFGGDTQVVPLSGKTGAGMAELEESLVTLSEILDLRADADAAVEGWVIEATTKASGRVATMLVKRGTIRPGDIVVAGITWGKIKTLKNEAGVEIASAGPGMPVEIDGWKEQPAAGDEVLQATTEAIAKDVMQFRQERVDRLKLATDMEAVNESRRLEQEKREREEAIARARKAGLTPEAASDLGLSAESAASGIKEVNFIVKGDVSGSVEAVINSVTALGNEEVRARVLRSGVGPVSEFDIEHATAATGHVIAFNSPVDGQMRRMAEANGIGVIEGNIIYRLVDDVKAKLSEHLTPLVTQRVTGEADVAETFSIKLHGGATKPFAGCKVRNGVVNRSSKVRVLRNKETVFDGKLSSLRNVKKDVTEMKKGSECGLGFDGWDGFRQGDQVQCYEESREKRFL